MTKTMERIYQTDLKTLIDLARQIPNTRMMSIAKISALILMNMRYEKIAFSPDLPEHPFVLVSRLVEETCDYLRAWQDASFIEQPGSAVLPSGPHSLEEDHRELFQKLWVNFNEEDYEKRIERYVHRLRINQLSGSLIRGKRGIDFGCGHGNFEHAFLREGAAYMLGIDFGRASIKYAKQARDRLGLAPDRLEFKEASVYQVPAPDASFDFAVQNGVFHHLEDEDRAIREMHRVLKNGGWIWYYTDGSGGISYELWDASVAILKDIPEALIIDYLKYLNIETGKRYHLGDGLNAVYRHTTWDEITKRLARFGFSEFRRLSGGFPTDTDADAIAKDEFGKEKFGEGDLRIFARKL